MEQFNTFFLNPIKNQYTDFYGIATRQQYWMFVLFYVVIYVVLAIVDSIIGMSLLTLLYSLALLVPSLAIAARRLHDTGRSGWWQLIALTVIGIIVLIVFLVQPSKTTDNPFLGGGANPAD